MSDLQISSRITPFLWFDSKASEAADFYISVFKNSRRLSDLRASVDLPGGVQKGGTLTVSFELDGLRFTALNGGPGHPLTDAISFVVRCDSQEEIDYYWAKLTEGGAEVACGWLKDKFGLSWQIVPARIGELLNNPKAIQAMMSMKKLIIADLENAGKS